MGHKILQDLFKIINTLSYLTLQVEREVSQDSSTSVHIQIHIPVIIIILTAKPQRRPLVRLTILKIKTHELLLCQTCLWPYNVTI